MSDDHNYMVDENEDISVRNPYCLLEGNKLSVKCFKTIDQCVEENNAHDKTRCPHYSDSLTRRQEIIRDQEIERLNRIKEKCENKIKRIEKIKEFLDEKGDIITGIGCFGCLIWLAFFIVCMAAGVYAIRWAWKLLCQAWSIPL